MKRVCLLSMSFGMRLKLGKVGANLDSVKRIKLRTSLCSAFSDKLIYTIDRPPELPCGAILTLVKNVVDPLANSFAIARREKQGT